MADDFDACMAFTYSEEGSQYVDNSKDSGGPTRYGITLSTYRNWTGNTNITATDIENLTETQTTPIYKSWYWDRMKCPVLPSGVDLMVFDFGVNASPGRSVILLQQTLKVTQDGVIGPETQAALRQFDPATLIDLLAEAHTDYYKGCYSFRTFGRDWLARTDRCQKAALAMTLPAKDTVQNEELF